LPTGYQTLGVVADEVAEPGLLRRHRLVDDPGDISRLARGLHLPLIEEPGRHGRSFAQFHDYAGFRI